MLVCGGCGGGDGDEERQEEDEAHEDQEEGTRPSARNGSRMRASVVTAR